MTTYKSLFELFLNIKCYLSQCLTYLYNMRNAEHITIETFLGETWLGKQIGHQRELPKSAIRTKCDYTIDMKDLTLYTSYGKVKKTYILIGK